MDLFAWFQDILISLGDVTSWLITPIVEAGELAISPLALVTGGGLVIYLGVAITKWFLS